MNTSRFRSAVFGCLFLMLLVPSHIGRAGGQEADAPSAHAQHAHAANADMQRHHSCLEEEQASIERGEGFGMAMAADHAGYPGPRHVLDLAADLHLSAEQRTAMEKVFAGMHENALAQGKGYLAAQARLEQMFREGSSEAELREQVSRVDSLHADLRWVHLSAHLAAQKILTPEQIAMYERLRKM